MSHKLGDKLLVRIDLQSDILDLTWLNLSEIGAFLGCLKFCEKRECVLFSSSLPCILYKYTF